MVMHKNVPVMLNYSEIIVYLRFKKNTPLIPKTLFFYE